MNQSSSNKQALPEACFDSSDRILSLLDMEESDEAIREELSDQPYIIKEKIASGGLKSICRAFNQQSARDVAYAVLLEDKESTENFRRFKREAKMSALLEHANIIPVYDVHVGDKPYFTMKLVLGKNLSELIFTDQVELSLNESLRIFIKICDAVSYAHSRGIIHLDLKPDNIKIDAHKEVLLHDWGLAKRVFIPDGDHNDLAIDEVDSTDQILGTPSYMAPEQFRPHDKLTDERTDIYSLGGILYSLLSRKTPFPRNDINFERRASAPSEVSSTNAIPASLDAVCLKAMEHDPEKRYQSAAELADEVQRYLDGFATNAENAGLGTLIKLIFRRHKKACVAISFTVTLVVLIVAGFINKLQESKAATLVAFQEAQKSQKEAVEALIKAEQNFKLYETEREERLTISELASKNIINTPLTFDKWQSKRYKEKLDFALKATPMNLNVHKKLLVLHIYNEELFKAIEIYDKHVSNTNFIKTAAPILKKYAKVKAPKSALPIAEFTSMLHELNKAGHRWLANGMMRTRMSYSKSSEGRIYLINHVLKSCNPMQTNWDFQYKTNDGQVFTSIDLSDHHNVGALTAFSGSFIGELNLSGTGTFHASTLGSTYVKELIITGKKIQNPKELQKVPGLEIVILRQGQITPAVMEQIPRIQFSFVD